MPRGKPTSIIEERKTLGTFERQWLVEQEQYVKSKVRNVELIGMAYSLSMPIGLGLLGWGVYEGCKTLGWSIGENGLPNGVGKTKWEHVAVLSAAAPVLAQYLVGAKVANWTAKQTGAVDEVRGWFGFNPLNRN